MSLEHALDLLDQLLRTSHTKSDTNMKFTLALALLAPVSAFVPGPKMPTRSRQAKTSLQVQIC